MGLSSAVGNAPLSWVWLEMPFFFKENVEKVDFGAYN